MNRKERRAARKAGEGAGALPGAAAPAALFGQAIRHHQRGEWLDAEAYCRAVLAANPMHIGSLHLLGVIAQQRGEHEAAIECFGKVLTVNERIPECHCDIGRSHEALGRFDEAIAHYRRAIKLKPEEGRAHHGLATALAAQGKIDDAVAAYERALALAPGAPRRPPELPEIFVNLGNLNAQQGRPQIAAQFYERALALKPDYAEAHNNLGAVLLAQGKTGEAAGHFLRALELTPELYESFSNVAAMLYRLNPALKRAADQAAQAWPQLLSEDALFAAAGLGAVAGDIVLRHVLETVPVYDVALERVLTSLRLAVLKRAAGAAATDRVGENELRFGCALARQCFINEYVFALAADESEQALALRQRLVDALAAGGDVPPLWLAAVAGYFPLAALPHFEALLARTWPDPVEGLLTQQIREVMEERRLREFIPRLTAIEDEVSLKVRRQYEENPYPRWVVAASPPKPLTVDEYLRRKFPAVPFQPIGGAGVDILIAGCGTGQHPIGIARTFAGARVLAVDLSLASLCYALRKTRAMGLPNIEYAQADILQLGALGRTFDVVDASGVLHHLADPMAGWRILLSLLRPHGLMSVGLYSALGRRDVAAAQRFVAERGYRPILEDIRRCRHELLASPLKAIASFHDFFAMSECRDLLFHVQEHRHTIPQIQAFLRKQHLNFIGFESDSARRAYRLRYADDQAMTDLDRWHALESEEPKLFAAMYQFWVQKG
jgi:tetratricopeptide (TPR) repeat protein